MMNEPAHSSCGPAFFYCKINDIILVIIACVLFSGGCRLCQTEIKPMTPAGMPLIALVVLIVGVTLGIYALKRIFRKK